ncbi:MAG: amidohydrolase family protein [Cyanobacteria bacterium]|nr:amidohydrolase family protein [Cyanobacteriota bacterium]
MPITYHLAHWILPVSSPPIYQGFLQVEKDRITAIGKIQDLSPSLQEALLGQSKSLVMTPGFINTHCHLELSYGASVPLLPGQSMIHWLMAVFRAKKDMESQNKTREALSLQGLQEMITTGTTCVNDISTQGESLAAMAALGVRGIVSMEFFHPGAVTGNLDAFIETLQQNYETHFQGRALSLTSQNNALVGLASGNALLNVGLSPHAPYNVSPKVWKAVLDSLSPQWVHTHLAESQDELDWLSSPVPDVSQGQPLKGIYDLHQTLLGQIFAPHPVHKNHPTPIEYLQHFECLTPGLIMAHGVFTTASDLKILKEKGICLAHCPRSNLYLQGRTLNWQGWENQGIPVGLGTDSILSNEDLDLRNEARVAQSLHHWGDEDTLGHLTLEGARVLGKESTLGSLTPGKQGDFVLWDFTPDVLQGHSTENISQWDPYSLCLNPALKVANVYVAGQEIYNASEGWQ